MSNRLRKLLPPLSLLLSFTFNPGSAAATAELFNQIKASVPIIYTVGGVCSGALLENDLVLTAAHCVNRFRPLRINWPGMAENEFVAGKVIHFDDKNDVAIIRLAEKNRRQPFKMIPTDSGLSPGLSIATIGHPRPTYQAMEGKKSKADLSYFYTKGSIAKVSTDSIALSLTAGFGNSGGPLFDDQGQLISTISRIDNSFVYVAHPEIIRKAIQEAKSTDAEISPREAKTNMDLYLWAGWHSFVSKIRSHSSLSFGELGLHVADRLSFGVSSNFSEGFRYNGVSIGWRFLHEFSDPLKVAYSNVGIESVSFLLNPSESNSDLLVRKGGQGLFYILNSGRTGYALRLGIHQIDGKSETQLAVGLFF